jgi:hypothetical protein
MFFSLECQIFYHSILANFLGRDNENTCEKREKRSLLYYQGRMFGIS